MDLLRSYEQASGQLVNPQKSAFVVRKRCSARTIRTLKRITGFRHCQLPITYLGAPLYVGNRRETLFADLLDKIRGKLRGWDKVRLSHGGRLLLIKSVLQSMPLHLFHVLRPPASVVVRLEKIFNAFFWGDYGTRTAAHWDRWESVCFDFDEGGFGVRRLQDVVDAFSCKLWWLFRCQGSIWARFLKARYVEHHSNSHHPVPAGASPIWRRLVKWRSLAESQIFWRIGRGDISFWNDHWCGQVPLAQMVAGPPDRGDSVSDFWDDSGNWCLERLSQQLPHELVDVVLDVALPHTPVDSPVWKPTPNGQFSMKSAWELLRVRQDRNVAMRHLWSPLISPTISIFMWRLLKNKIPVDVRLQAKGFSLASKCHCCNQVESVDHLFLDSDFAREIWRYFSDFFGIALPGGGSVGHVFSCWCNSSPFITQAHIRVLIPILVFWHIWEARNDAKYRAIRFSPKRIIHQVTARIHLIARANLFTLRHWRGDKSVACRLGLHPPPAPPRRSLAVWWTTPRPGEWKLNTDGAFRQTEQRAGGGGILRDHHGTPIFGFTYYLGQGSSLEAELSAIHQGLHLCVAKGFTNLWLETDSQLAVQMLQNDSTGSWRTQHLLDGTRQLLRHFPIRISHIYREGNKPADFLANKACTDQITCELRPQDFDSLLTGLLRLDRWGFPSFRHS